MQIKSLCARSRSPKMPCIRLLETSDSFHFHAKGSKFMNVEWARDISTDRVRDNDNSYKKHNITGV